MASESTDPGAPRRLHWSTIAFRVVGLLRGLLLPAIGVLLAARGSKWELIFALFVFPALAFEIIRYFTRRYRFTDEDFIVTEGLFFRNERHIPYQRIQNIDLVQNLFHRALNVAEVRLETGSGGKPEAELRVIGLDAVEELRARIFHGRAAGSTDSTAAPGAMLPAADRAAGADLLVAIPTGELVRLGLIVNRGLALVAVLIGVSWELDLWDRIAGFEQLREWFNEVIARPGVLLVAIGLAACVFLWTLSIIWSILRFHGFTLHRHGDDLRLSCGLLTRLAATVPRRRIQVISIQAKPLHRLFQRVTIRIETAGGNTEEGEQKDTISQRWFVPIIHRDRAMALVREIQPDFDFDTDSSGWQPLAPRAAWRRARLVGVVSMIGSAAAGYVLGMPWGIVLAVALPVVMALWAWLAVKRTCWMMTPRGFIVQHGVLSRATTMTLINKVQTVEIAVSPFDRRWNMAGLTIDTAGAGATGERLSLAYLPFDVANHLRDAIATRAESIAVHPT